jgi:hypothetical protein
MAKMPNALSAVTTKVGYSQFGSRLYGLRTDCRLGPTGRATRSDTATSVTI